MRVLSIATALVNIAISLFIILLSIGGGHTFSPFAQQTGILYKVYGIFFLSVGYASVSLALAILILNAIAIANLCSNRALTYMLISTLFVTAGSAFLLSFINESFGGVIGYHIKDFLIKTVKIPNNTAFILALFSTITPLSLFLYPAITTLLRKVIKKDSQNDLTSTQNKQQIEPLLSLDETSHSTELIKIEYSKPAKGERLIDIDQEEKTVALNKEIKNKQNSKNEKKQKEEIGKGILPHICEKFIEGDDSQEDGKSTKGGKYDFILPSLDLLDEPEASEYDPPAVLSIISQDLLRALESFGITGKIISMTSGPVVNFFEFIPASGIRATRLIQYTDDIAIAMRLPGIRIIAPVPGSGAVGFEVPRSKRSIVRLKEVIDAPESKKMKIPLAIGKDIYGRPFVIDLHKLPHLLVAGTTGSGKSVLLNSIVANLLFRFTPDELKLILVDPKMLEFSPYSGIPNLITDVITNPRGAIDVLRWAVDEMLKRYQVMKKEQAKNIDNYVEKTGEKIPKIVIVIDEFADLMVSSARKVEEYIMRLSQMARAAGIHIILTTQRPSADVVTGIIKANLPARIALRVSDKTNSRVILDVNGAETLLGQGDFLFSMPGIMPQRGHACFISDDEIARIIEHLKAQREPEYIQIVSQDEEEDILNSELFGDKDPKFREAVEIAKNYGQVSISLLQRKLGIGFNRAARIVEEMEEAGIVKKHDKKLVYIGLNPHRVEKSQQNN